MAKIYVRNRKENIFYFIYNMINNQKDAINAALFGYVFSLIIVMIDDILKGSNLKEIIFNYLCMPPRAILLWGCIAIILIIKILNKILTNYFKEKSIEERFFRICETHTDSIFSDYYLEGYGWGENKTFIACPYLEQGLKCKQVKFKLSKKEYDLSELIKNDKKLKDIDIMKEYQEYKNNFYDKNYQEEDRIMLAQRDNIFTDDNELKIKLKKVKYSQIRFFRECVLNGKFSTNANISDNTNLENRKRYLKYLYNRSDIFIPNNFSLHIVVVTSDNKIVLSNDTGVTQEYKKDWVPTINSIITENDFNQASGLIGENMISRMLKEELNIGEECYEKEDIRFLSIYCEGQICNLDFMCLVELTIDEEELTEILLNKPNIQYDFMTIEEIPRELLYPTRKYNGSTDIRLLYTYINQKGEKEFKTAILDEALKNK